VGAEDDEAGAGPPERYVPVSGGGGPQKGPSSAPAEDRTLTTSERGVLIYRGRAMEPFGGDPNGARGWARAVNKYHDELAGRASVYAILAPSQSAFYLPPEYQRRSRPQKPHIDTSYALLRPGVRAADAYGELQQHVAEYLYYRTDHHATGLGAYYMYRAFCRTAKLEPVPLQRMRKGVQNRWLGSLYWLTRDARLRKTPDQVEYFVPPVETQTVIYPSSGRGKPRPAPLFREGNTGYGVFLGGDYAMMVARTSLTNGRRVVLVKNSQGNAFATLLVSHFEEVVVIDYRYFDGSLLDLIRERKMTDVILFNGVFSANGPYHTWRMREILRGPSPKGRAPASQP
jgi:hypothetical protein